MKEPFALINLNSIDENIQVIKKQASEKLELIAVIKADGYGHGAYEVSRIIEKNVSILAVARLSEALSLRKQGVNKPIMIFSGLNSVEDLLVAVEHRILVVIHSLFQLDLFSALPEEAMLNCWLKFDSGMHRLGLSESEIEKAILIISKQYRNVIIDGLFTHLSSAESDLQRTLYQLRFFESASRGKSFKTSVTNSAGLLSKYKCFQDYGRLGLSLYGVSPFIDSIGKDLGLKPVMELKAYVISIRMHKAGEPVGYGGKWVSNNDTKLAVVGIGYADGYPRSISPGCPVLINGKNYPIVGAVSMDLISVDIGLVNNVQELDEVTLWGPKLPVEIIAKSAGMIPYELLVGVTKRVARVYS